MLARRAAGAVAGGDGLAQALVTVHGRHHTHRGRHAGQVRRGHLVVQEVVLSCRYSNFGGQVRDQLNHLLAKLS
jgi:hypothetical protein